MLGVPSVVTRCVVACFALLLMAQPVVAGAEQARGKRVETESYTGTSPALATEPLYASACPSQTEGDLSCLRFDLEPRDRFIALEIEDDSGNPVYGIVWDASERFVAEFCGKTDKRVRSPGGPYIQVEVIAANTRLDCYPSTVTEGTVTVTFTGQKRR